MHINSRVLLAVYDFVYDLQIYIKTWHIMLLTTKSFCYMFNVCNIKHYFWLNNIGTSIVSCQEVHVFNTWIAYMWLWLKHYYKLQEDMTYRACDTVMTG